MTIFNLIIALIIIILQYLNMNSITKTIKIKNTFMFLNLVSNDFVTSSVRPFKQKMLMFNRLFFIATIVVAPIFIIFNKSALFLSLYIIIFLLLPFFVNQYLITKNIEQLKNLNVIHSNQPININLIGLFYLEDNDTLFYKYGHSRYALNIAKTKGKAILASACALFIALLLAIALFINPNSTKLLEIDSVVNDTELVFKYDTYTTKIPVKNITSVKQIEELPSITSKIDGIQKDNLIIGTFNLQGMEKATLFVEKNAKSFIVIQANKKYYIFSDDNEMNSKTVYDTINKKIPKNNTKK